MRTLIVVVIGCLLALLFNALLPVRRANGGARTWSGPRVFTALWLVASILDLLVGVQAGHGVPEEAAIHVVVFAVPAALAWYLLRRARNHRQA